jgi:hypothetical protein
MGSGSFFLGGGGTQVSAPPGYFEKSKLKKKAEKMPNINTKN